MTENPALQHYRGTNHMARPTHADKIYMIFRSGDGSYNYPTHITHSIRHLQTIRRNYIPKTFSLRVMCSCSRQKTHLQWSMLPAQASFQGRYDLLCGFGVRKRALTMPVTSKNDDTNAYACQKYGGDFHGVKQTDPSSTNWRGCGRPQTWHFAKWLSLAHD